MEVSQQVQSEVTPPASHTPSVPPFEWKRLEFVVPIIFSIVGFAACGAGLAGFFRVGVLSNLGQVNALILMSAGGGAGVIFLIDAILAGVKQRISSYEVPYGDPCSGFVLSHIPIVGKSIDINYQQQISNEKNAFLNNTKGIVKALKKLQTEFQGYIRYPEKPFVIRDKTQSEQIEYFWDFSLESYGWQSTELSQLSFSFLKDDKEILAQVEEISKLRQNYIQTRKDQYSQLIISLDPEAVLGQARRFYLKSLSSLSREEVKKAKESVNQMKRDEILAILHERCSGLNSPEKRVEMEAILELFGQ